MTQAQCDRVLTPSCDKLQKAGNINLKKKKIVPLFLIWTNIPCYKRWCSFMSCFQFCTSNTVSVTWNMTNIYISNYYFFSSCSFDINNFSESTLAIQFTCMSLEYSSFSGGMMALLDDVKTSQRQDPGSIFNCHNHTFAYVTRPVVSA